MRNKEIKKAIEILKNGGIVIFPTDTAYGIGCKMDDEKAVKRLFEIRKRPKTQAVPVLVDSTEMVQKYSKPARLATPARHCKSFAGGRSVAGRHLTDNPPGGEAGIKQLMKDYWPGALTIVLPCKTELVLDLVRGGGESIGFRMPNHNIPLTLIKELGLPILGPSANFHGKNTPYSFKELDPDFLKLVDYVIPGDCPLKQVSTVIDVSKEPWRIIRQGAVKIAKNKLIKNKRIILFIDTSDSQKTTIGLEINGQKGRLTETSKILKAQNALPLIDKILKKHKIKIEDITGLEINCGPGSFTGLRVGIAIANALSLTLNIAVNNKEIGKIIVPEY